MNKILLLSFLVSGCSVAHYTRHPDGTVDAYGYALGTDTALDGFEYQTDSKGMVQLQMQGLDRNQSKSINEASGAIGNIIGTALKIYTGKP